jgi:nitroreductase
MDRPVERELLEKILDAAIYAPSAENNQSTELIIVQNRQVISDLVKRTIGYLTTNMKILKNPVMGRVAQLLYGEMLKGENRQRLIHDIQLLYERYMNGDDWILHHAPAVILFHGNKQMTLAAANANLAVQNASLVVETLGLGSFYTGYLVVAAESNREIPRSLGIPTANKIYGALAVGYPQYEYKKWIGRVNPNVKWL